jgi:hypothetical protein
VKASRVLLHLLAICFTLLGLSGAVAAQDVQPVEPLALASEPVMLEFSVGAAGPPTIEPLTDGRMTFRIQAAGEVTGALDGSISAKVSEVTPAPSPAYHSVTIIFTIETEQGQIEGYYAGSFHQPEGSDQAEITAVGKILSVSGAYADLYLADVYVSSEVQFVDGRSVGESGTMLIAAR